MSEQNGMLSALVAALRNYRRKDPELASEASEEIAKRLPPLVNPMAAVTEKRRQMAQLDEVGRE